MTLHPGTLVAGPFWSDDEDREGVGVIVAQGRLLWTRTPKPYVPVKIISGDRASGGYHPTSLRVTGYKVTAS